MQTKQAAAQPDPQSSPQPTRREPVHDVSDPLATGTLPDSHHATSVPRPGMSHDLLLLQRTVGNRSVNRLVRHITDQPHSLARAVDTSKAEPIRKELNSMVYVSNTKLEELWASLGTALPEAINHPAYRDLWWQSVNKEKISLTEAGKPLLKAFAADTVAVARDHVSSQHTRLENLQQELKNAAKQKQSSAPPDKSIVGGVEDANKAMSRSTVPKPFAQIRDLVDTATLAHFLLNWEDILKTAPIGVRRVDTSRLLNPPGPPSSATPFNPFPNSPSNQNGTSPNGMGAQSADAGLAPLLFDPNMSIEKLLESPGVEYVDRTAFDAIRKTYQDCIEEFMHN